MASSQCCEPIQSPNWDKAKDAGEKKNDENINTENTYL